MQKGRYMEEKIDIAFYTRSSVNAYHVRSKCKSNNLNLGYIVDLDDFIVSLIYKKKGIIIIDSKYLKHTNLITAFCQCRNSGEYKFIYLTNNRDDVSIDDKDVYVYTYDELDKFVNDLPLLIVEANRIYSEKRKEIFSNIITEMLENYKVSPKYIGFNYLKECIENILKNKGQVRFLNTQVYPIVAQMYNTTIENVEKSIRIAIKNARLAHPELYSKENFSGEKITNRVFVSHIVEKINLNHISEYNN